ncbi:uncharacterized protein LOC124436429 [Xenia sp. Carnegie-2017]|uniref:uncharacterized protein LOC124436429 n=1 Tax=Xenia sp. Carnegie-2017 TaxID=2897299 RepID=UPI001F037B1A|nr:uncharacterized protein LOC124436429 [Xenia sp. Carnegie-2017]
MQLNNNSFLITSKVFENENLAMWGTGCKQIGTNIDIQFWQLKEEPNYPGYFYICNTKYDGYRIANLEKGIICENIPDNESQLFKFEEVGDSYYQICNYKKQEAKLTKLGKENDELGFSDGTSDDNQSWKLVPRFKAYVTTVTICSYDNRKESESFSTEISVTTGLKFEPSSSFLTTVGLKESLMASVSSAEADETSKLQIKADIQRLLSNGQEENWFHESPTRFNIPVGMNYRVKQLTRYFSSPLKSDYCNLRCDYIIDETPGEFH